MALSRRTGPHLGSMERSFILLYRANSCAMVMSMRVNRVTQWTNGEKNGTRKTRAGTTLHLPCKMTKVLELHIRITFRDSASKIYTIFCAAVSLEAMESAGCQ